MPICSSFEASGDSDFIRFWFRNQQRIKNELEEEQNIETKVCESKTILKRNKTLKLKCVIKKEDQRKNQNDIKIVKLKSVRSGLGRRGK